MAKRVAELSGAELDYWVAKAEGLKAEIERGVCEATKGFGWFWYSPSSDWEKGGLIIEREEIAIIPGMLTGIWSAAKVDMQNMEYFTGSTPLEAAMRCYVASRFGDTVEETKEEK